MISVAGTLVADLIIRPIRSWPGKSQNANVDHIEILPGGAVANTGMALARLGVPVSACAALGEDNIGMVVKDSVKPMGLPRSCHRVTLQPNDGQRGRSFGRWGSLLFKRCGRL